MRDSSKNSNELEQKKFSFDFQSSSHRADEAREPVAEMTHVPDRSGETDTADYKPEREDETRDCLPGNVLSAERKRRGLSVADIANQLFLTEKQIVALEADDYGSFPAAIFVRGYIRNYARQLGLPPDPLVALFNAQSSTSAPDLEGVSHTSERMAKRNAPPFGPRLVIVTVVVILLLLLWWGMSPTTDESVAIDDVPVADGFSSSPPVTVVEEIVTPLQLAPELPQAPAKKVAEEVAEVAPVNAVKEKEVPLETPPQAEFIADRAVAESFPDTMVLTFSAESWVEITDANDRRVMFDLGKPGQTRVLSGTAPFKVLFGYSQAVKMTFNGEVFDQSSLARGKVARFTLGNNSE